MTVDDIISQGLKVAGNTGLATADALDALNNFLQAEYRRKYRWQRKTVTLNLGVGQPADTADWDTTFLDLYQHENGSVGRYNVPNTSPVQTQPMWALDYRRYIARSDRLSAQGPPRYIVGDAVGASWFVYPAPDRSYTAFVDIYYLPAKSAAGQTPLWSNWAPDEILVQVVKVWALEWMQDERFTMEKKLLFGDAKAEIPGMLPTYRRREAAVEGRAFQSAMDPRVFPSMAGWAPGDSASTVWD